jgi:hypothetical protein
MSPWVGAHGAGWRSSAWRDDLVLKPHVIRRRCLSASSSWPLLALVLLAARPGRVHKQGRQS